MEIGVIGYSAQDFDHEKAEMLLDKALQPYYSINDVVISSGFTNVGVPAIAYKLAKQNGLKTKGVACSKAKNYKTFPCDYVTIVGKNWGDESETFLCNLDLLIRVGGGKQSFTELARAKELGIECVEINL